MTDDQKRCLMLRVACLTEPQWKQVMRDILYASAGSAGLGEPLVDAICDKKLSSYLDRDNEAIQHFDGLFRIFERVETDLQVIAATEKMFVTLRAIDNSSLPQHRYALRVNKASCNIPWADIADWCDMAIRQHPVKCHPMPMTAEL